MSFEDDLKPVKSKNKNTTLLIFKWFLILESRRWVPSKDHNGIDCKPFFFIKNFSSQTTYVHCTTISYHDENIENSLKNQ